MGGGGPAVPFSDSAGVCRWSNTRDIYIYMGVHVMFRVYMHIDISATCTYICIYTHIILCILYRYIYTHVFVHTLIGVPERGAM